MPRKRKPKEGQLDLAENPSPYDAIREASTAISLAKRGTERLDGEAALDAVAKLIAVADPSSRVRALPWRQVVSLLASDKLRSDDLKRSRWPNGDETLVT